MKPMVVNVPRVPFPQKSLFGPSTSIPPPELHSHFLFITDTQRIYAVPVVSMGPIRTEQRVPC